MGSAGSIGVGLDHSLALRSAEDDVDFPTGPVHENFMQRFLPAYRAELTDFFEVASGRSASSCTVRDALQAFRTAEACELSRAQRRPVSMTEIPDAPARGKAPA